MVDGLTGIRGKRKLTLHCRSMCSRPSISTFTSILTMPVFAGVNAERGCHPLKMKENEGW